jgi:hypothetical protein
LRGKLPDEEEAFAKASFYMHIPDHRPPSERVVHRMLPLLQRYPTFRRHCAVTRVAFPQRHDDFSNNFYAITICQMTLAPVDDQSTTAELEDGKAMSR